MWVLLERLASEVGSLPQGGGHHQSRKKPRKHKGTVVFLPEVNPELQVQPGVGTVTTSALTLSLGLYVGGTSQPPQWRSCDLASVSPFL